MERSDPALAFYIAELEQRIMVAEYNADYYEEVAKTLREEAAKLRNRRSAGCRKTPRSQNGHDSK